MYVCLDGSTRHVSNVVADTQSIHSHTSFSSDNGVETIITSLDVEPHNPTGYPHRKRWAIHLMSVCSPPLVDRGRSRASVQPAEPRSVGLGRPLRAIKEIDIDTFVDHGRTVSGHAVRIDAHRLSLRACGDLVDSQPGCPPRNAYGDEPALHQRRRC